MESVHLSDDELRAFVEGGAVRPEAGAHFVTCGWCQKRLGALSKKGAKALSDLAPALAVLRTDPHRAYEGALRLWAEEIEARVSIREMLRKREFDAEQLAHLSPFTLGHTVASISDDLRQQDSSLLYKLCALALEKLSIRAGVETGQDLEPQKSAAIRQVRCQLRAELGNCLRIRGNFREARPHIVHALNSSRTLPSLTTQGRIQWMAALYCRDTRDFRRAQTLGEAALASLLGAEETIVAEYVSFLLASIPYLQGDLELAETRLKDLLARCLEDDLTELAATHLLAKVLALNGDFFNAGRLLKALRSLAARWKSSPSIAANTLWLRALIVGGHDNHQAAAQHLEKVVEAFLDLDSPLDAALAGVDLAYYQLRAGDPEKAARTALSSASFLETHESDYPETYAAACLFHATVETNQAMDRSKYLEFARLLDQTRHRPNKTPKGGLLDPA